MRGIIRYCGVLFVAVTLHASALAGPIVATKSGAIEGVDRGGVLAFLGVPFAAPPVRNLRWRPPAPVASVGSPPRADQNLYVTPVSCSDAVHSSSPALEYLTVA